MGVPTMELELMPIVNLAVLVAGMLFSNSMNTISPTADRIEAELGHGVLRKEASRAALDAALIPQINALLAVGLVALPGMMTGRILAGPRFVIQKK